MNTLDPINFTIEFVKLQANSGGGSEVVNVSAQTGDIAGWVFLAVLLVGVVAFCCFKFSRSFVLRSSTVSSKHVKKTCDVTLLAILKACIFTATICLLAYFSFATTIALAESQNNDCSFKPGIIQVFINEETGEATCNDFNFVNNTCDYFLFTNSTLSLTESAAEVSTSEDWAVTINALGLNANLFAGQPGDYTVDYDSVKVMNPGESTNVLFKLDRFDKDIVNQLIGKKVFSLSLNPADNIVKVPNAVDGLVYTGAEHVGVLGGAGYKLVDNAKTNAGNYTAIATLDNGLIWPDKSNVAKEINWSIRKADGKFDVYPTAHTLTYSGEFQALIERGSSSYGATVVYKTEDMIEYSSSIPVAKDANNYTVYAHVVADDNHFQSPDYVVENVSISQNVIKSIKIQGFCDNKSFKDEGQYIFPNYGDGEKAYKVESYELYQPSVSGLISASKITPNEHGEIPSITVDCNDTGSHELNLKGYSWKYNDSNIISNEDTVWEIYNGNLQINMQDFVQIKVTVAPEKVQIGDTVSYEVKLTNKIQEAVTGEIQLNTDSSTKQTVELPSLGEDTITMSYLVKGSDFLYPSLVNVIKYSATIDDVPYIVYDSISTAFEYKKATVPFIGDSYYTGVPHKPFEGNHEGYDIVVGGGSVSEATDAGTYTSLIVLQPGYKWIDASPLIYRLVTWKIKPIDVLIHFDIEDAGYTTTYGSAWELPENAITYTATQPLPAKKPTLTDILGDDPTSDFDYNQGDFTGEYSVLLKLPEKSKWNPNYSISSKNSKLTVYQKTLSLQWVTVYAYTGKLIEPDILCTGQYGQDKISFDVKAYLDDEHTKEVSLAEPNKYYCVANIKGSINQRNYVIHSGHNEAQVKIFAVGDKKLKAVITTSLFDSTYTLNIVYDTINYMVGSDGVVAWFEVTEDTSFDPSKPDTAKFPPWHNDETVLTKINKVVFCPSFACDYIYLKHGDELNSLDGWFANMPNLYSVEGTENICASSILENLSIKGLFYNSGSNVHSSIDLTKLDFEGKCNSIYADGMFQSAKYREIEFPENKNSFNKITSCQYMFDSCTNLEGIINGDFSLCEGNIHFKNMFNGCSSLKNLNISNWSFNSLGNTDNMFNGCSSLEKISCKIGTDWTTGFEGTSTNMFAGCTQLPHFLEIPVTSPFGITYAKGCNSTNWGVVKGLFSEPEEPEPVFSQDDGKATIDNDGTLRFYVQGELTSTNEIWNVPLNGEDIPWTATEERRKSIKNIEVSNNFKIWVGQYVTSTKAWFKKLTEVRNIDFSNCKMNLVLDMSDMFKECENLTYINLTNLITPSVVNMSSMFNNCHYLTLIDGIEKLNVSNVHNMNNMFSYTNLVSFNGTKWSVGNVEDFSYMFCNIKGITDINLSNWDVSNCTTFEWMFAGCKSVQEINIRSFDLSEKATTVEFMFGSCYTLQDLFCNDNWTGLSVIDDDLFSGCRRLPGYDSLHEGKEKAYKGSGGYFS